MNIHIGASNSSHFLHPAVILPLFGYVPPNHNPGRLMCLTTCTGCHPTYTEAPANFHLGASHFTGMHPNLQLGCLQHYSSPCVVCNSSCINYLLHPTWKIILVLSFKRKGSSMSHQLDTIP